MNKKLTITISKIILVLLAVYFGNMIFENYYSSLVKNYTIGVLGEKYRLPNQGSRINFHFYYWGEKFQSDNFLGTNEISKDQLTYLIEVPIKDIKKSRILWNYPVPDTLKAPYEGWEEKAAFLKKNKGNGSVPNTNAAGIAPAAPAVAYMLTNDWISQVAPVNNG